DQVEETATSMEREQNRRIWWTLFILDQELASRGGSPTIIDERFTKVTTPLSSEQVCICNHVTPSQTYSNDYQILYPGLHTPLSWQNTAASLCRLKREIVQAVYTERSENSISFSTISNS